MLLDALLQQFGRRATDHRAVDRALPVAERRAAQRAFAGSRAIAAGGAAGAGGIRAGTPAGSGPELGGGRNGQRTLSVSVTPEFDELLGTSATENMGSGYASREGPVLNGPSLISEVA
jgi:hypothetical protein